MKYLILLVFFVGCGNKETVKLSECKEILSETSRGTCSSSKSCITESSDYFMRYVCFCNEPCVCFYGFTKVNDECMKPDDKKCIYDSTLLLTLDEGFCTRPTIERDRIIDEWTKIQVE